MSILTLVCASERRTEPSAWMARESASPAPHSIARPHQILHTSNGTCSANVLDILLLNFCALRCAVTRSTAGHRYKCYVFPVYFILFYVILT